MDQIKWLLIAFLKVLGKIATGCICVIGAAYLVVALEELPWVVVIEEVEGLEELIARLEQEK